MKITTSIKPPTLHQIIKDLKLNYFIHKNKFIIYQNEIEEFKDINHVAGKFGYYDMLIYCKPQKSKTKGVEPQGRWVMIIGERESTSDKTYKLYNRIFNEIKSMVE